ncbi:hypothetical protein RQP46_010951 [Phenoliferia psychrophenolica]
MEQNPHPKKPRPPGRRTTSRSAGSSSTTSSSSAPPLTSPQAPVVLTPPSAPAPSTPIGYPFSSPFGSRFRSRTTPPTPGRVKTLAARARAQLVHGNPSPSPLRIHDLDRKSRIEIEIALKEAEKTLAQQAQALEQAAQVGLLLLEENTSLRARQEAVGRSPLKSRDWTLPAPAPHHQQQRLAPTPSAFPLSSALSPFTSHRPSPLSPLPSTPIQSERRTPFQQTPSSERHARRTDSASRTHITRLEEANDLLQEQLTELLQQSEREALSSELELKKLQRQVAAMRNEIDFAEERHAAVLAESVPQSPAPGLKETVEEEEGEVDSRPPSPSPTYVAASRSTSVETEPDEDTTERLAELLAQIESLMIQNGQLALLTSQRWDAAMESLDEQADMIEEVEADLSLSLGHGSLLSPAATDDEDDDDAPSRGPTTPSRPSPFDREPSTSPSPLPQTSFRNLHAELEPFSTPNHAAIVTGNDDEAIFPPTSPRRGVGAYGTMDDMQSEVETDGASGKDEEDEAVGCLSGVLAWVLELCKIGISFVGTFWR